ncbi:excalibur calcium-binding domain-containing protein [Arthrobacter sp. NPDC092385]|uniref:excalibur calcium-binding domain-containing protein n=1 Tax=Arthrobacter sp. NPDC092385 TaxID=3363943 RepID=UPI00380CA950
MNKRTTYLALAVTAGLTTMASPALATSVAPTDQVCAGLSSGKIDTQGDPRTVTLAAPEGMVITGYCVKAGSGNQGDGPEYVVLDPAGYAATLVISHSSGKAVSHYSFTTAPATPVDETPVDETPGGGTPVVETPVVVPPVVETPVVVPPVVETPVVETPVVVPPVVETPVVETPVVVPPVVGTPVVGTPVVGTPVVVPPVVGTPVVGTPVVETPVVGTPVAETPVVRTPVNDAPGTNVIDVPVVVVEVPDTELGFASEVYYENCDAVRAANAAPIHLGETGYRAGLDRDGDGIGCEAAGGDDRAVATSYGADDTDNANGTDELAYTGTGEDMKVAGGIGAALLALGAGVVLAGRGRHRKAA